MLRLTGGGGRWLVLAAVLALGGCAEAQLIAHSAKQVRDAAETEQARNAGTYKIGKPYQVAGVWYYPKVDYEYSETGIASWYGPGFHGKSTANGETYDQDDLTAAHRTLPLPSVVRVINLENGRSVKLRVNDRGPFAHGRIIDVSRRAAELLGFKTEGTAKVRVEIVEAASRRIASGALNQQANDSAPPAVPTVSVAAANLDGSGAEQPAPTSEPGRQMASAASGDDEPDGDVSYEPVGDSTIFIQAGAFTRYDNANQLRARLSRLGNVNIDSAMVEDRQFFRVRVGPVDSVDQADALLQTLVSNGYTQSRVVVVE